MGCGNENERITMTRDEEEDQKPEEIKHKTMQNT